VVRDEDDELRDEEEELFDEDDFDELWVLAPPEREPRSCASASLGVNTVIAGNVSDSAVAKIIARFIMRFISLLLVEAGLDTRCSRVPQSSGVFDHADTILFNHRVAFLILSPPTPTLTAQS
jgi:hypothetical protein